LHVNQIMGVLRRTFEGLIDLADVAHLDVTNRGSVFLSRALASFAVAQLAALEPAEAAQAVTDGAGDNGVDAIHYDRATKTLYVVQSKWFGSGRGSFDVSETMKLVKGFDDLVAQRFDRFNAKVAAKRGMVEAAFLDDKATYVLVMVHTGQDDLAPEPRQVIDDCLDRFNDWKDETTRELLQVRCLKQSDVYGMIARGAQGDPIDLEVVVHEWGKVENPFAVYGQVSAADVADWWAKGTVKLSSKGTEKRRGSLELQTYGAALAPVISAHIANACARTARYSAAGR
jgi:hypothetical protein